MSQMIKPLEAAIRPLAEAAGVQLYACRFIVEDGVQSFHVMIEQEGGVNINTCAELSRTINLMLQVEHSTISEKYQLMVTSPGLERPLIFADHYKAVIGETIKVTLRQVIDGAKRYKGILLACDDDQITVKTQKGDYTFKLSEIAKANVVWTKEAKK